MKVKDDVWPDLLPDFANLPICSATHENIQGKSLNQAKLHV